MLPDVLAMPGELTADGRHIALAIVGKQPLVTKREFVQVTSVLRSRNGDELADRPFEQRPERDQNRIARMRVEDAVEAHVETDHGRVVGVERRGLEPGD